MPTYGPENDPYALEYTRQRLEARLRYQDDIRAAEALDEQNRRAGERYDTGVNTQDIALPTEDAGGMKKVGTVFQSPSDIAPAPEAGMSPIDQEVTRHRMGQGPMSPTPADDLGLAGNQKNASFLDDIERAYVTGAGRPDESMDDLKARLGFSWGKSVQLGANGRPLTSSTIQDQISPERYAQANEAVGGGGVSTVDDPAIIPEWMIEEQRKRLELADPYGIRQRAEAANLDVQKATAIERGKVGVQDERAQRLMQLLDAPPDAQTQQAWAREFEDFRAESQYRAGTPEQRARWEAVLQAKQEAKLREQRRADLGLATGRATTTFKGDPNDPFGAAR